MTPDHATSNPDTDLLRELSVLYVEDEATIREQLTGLLARRMAAVHTAEDGEEGLTAFLRHKPDIVISDIQMPRMNGLEMAEAIKRVAPNTPVIIATAYKDSDLLLKAISLNVDKFLVKPIGKPQLLEALLGCARPLHAEKRRQESEAKYRMMMEQAADGIFLSDAEGRYLDVNEHGCRMLGFSREEILGYHIRDFLPPERHKNFQHSFELILSGHTALAETQLKCKDGSYLDAEVSAGLLGNGTIMATVRDISERKLAENALANSHRMFTTVLDSMDALVYVADMQTHEILFANCHARMVIGTELLNKTCWKTLQTEQSGPCEFCTNDRLLTPEGKPAGVYVWEFRNTVNRRWYLIRDQAIRWIDGRIVRMEIATDITERKEMEEALRQNRNSLIRAQHMAQLGSWEWRIREGMVSYSEETARIAGLAFPPGECAIEEFLRPIHPGDKIMALRIINAALFDGQPYDLEYRLAAAQGEEIRHVRNLGEIERDEDGTAVTLLGTMQDITERKQLEESILGISEKIRSEIGLELHDELGQQLTGIGFVGKMLENKLAKHGMAEATDAARIVQGVAEAINQTRTLARGLYPVELAENGLVDALEQLAHNTQEIFGVECTFKSLDPMIAYKDETAIHLYRIAQEAISNAIKHSKANCIQVSLLPDEDGIHLSVADNGIGLDRNASTNSRGMGLRIMGYRASLIGATLAILRGAQGGTIISVH